MELSITNQLLGAGLIAGIFFLIGLFVSWHKYNKKLRRAKDTVEETFVSGLPEHNAQVIEDQKKIQAYNRKMIINLYHEPMEQPFRAWTRSPYGNG